MKKSKKFILLSLACLTLVGSTFSSAGTWLKCSSCSSTSVSKMQGPYQCYECKKNTSYTYNCKSCGMSFDACTSCHTVYEPW